MNSKLVKILKQEPLMPPGFDTEGESARQWFYDFTGKTYALEKELSSDNSIDAEWEWQGLGINLLSLITTVGSAAVGVGALYLGRYLGDDLMLTKDEFYDDMIAVTAHTALCFVTIAQDLKNRAIEKFYTALHKKPYEE